MQNARHEGFAPVADENAKVLVLGTFPGLASRQAAQYYGNARNQFWRIVYAAFGAEYQSPAYAQKLAFLLKNGMALWDMVQSCETNGSLDTEIKAPKLVDLPAFLQKHPRITLICYNGGNAARYGKRLGELPVKSVVLPSTSPANARYSFESKLSIWSMALRPPGELEK